jgi:two-component system, NarL family, nitrate/nitrite response regulator NarL
MINILVADDHQLLIDGIKSTLAGVEDIRVVAEANNGYEVLEKLASGIEADIILMDINMPKLDGLNCTKMVLKDFPDIRIIALSQFDEKRFVKQMVKNGASGYLLKDVGKDELLIAIRAVYNGENYYFDQVSVSEINKEMRKEAGNTLFPNLTERESEILVLISKGFSTQQIADMLFISINTVETHRAHLIDKADVNNTAGLIRWAALNALLE